MSSAARPADHPRSRGVYTGYSVTRTVRGGSSPLARGLRCPLSDKRLSAGIIPARAGFTGADREAAEAHADHPRSRGVYDDGSDGEGAEVGSSPLARGLRCRRWRPRRRGRIIPARAGFTVSRSPRAPRGRDHPRSRGVYSSVSRRLLLPTGSSPLARGLLLLRLSRSAGIGIIPARAGFTRRPRKSHQYSPDHPRSRGVYAPLYC